MPNGLSSKDKKALTQNDYNKISNLYLNDFGTDSDNFELVKKAVEHIKEKSMADLPVTDLGSGGGNVTDFLRQNGLTKIEVIEFTPNFIKHLEGKYKNNPGIKIITNDMVSYLQDAKDDEYAGHFASYSIIHIPDEEVDQLFTDIYRTLKKHGVFLMSCQEGKYKGLEPEPYQIQSDQRLTITEKLESYMNYFMQAELKQRLTKAGFKKIEFKKYTPANFATGDFPVSKIWLLAEK